MKVGYFCARSFSIARRGALPVLVASLVGGLLLLSPGRAAACGSGIKESFRIFLRLARSAPTTMTELRFQDEWMKTQFEYYDEEYPLTVDVVATTFDAPQGIVFMLPGVGANFRGNFFTPEEDNLAQFLRDSGYLVVGITSRADSLPDIEDYSFMADWGIERHREDIREIIDIVTNATRLPYNIVAFSYSSMVALDYASVYPSDSLERVVLIDMYNIDPSNEGDVLKSNTLYNSYQFLIDSGYYFDSSVSAFGDLVAAALAYPEADSGVPRAAVLPPEIAPYFPGNFTYDGLLHFWMIYSGYLPGIHTPISGLPNDWPLLLSSLAGDYTMAPDPLNDTFSFTHTSSAVLSELAANMGSALIPLALQRDCAALSAYNGAYSIDWSNIEAEVVWINTALGYGDQAYAATQIENVSFYDIENYGNLDPFLSATAEDDLWPLVLP
jgi:pimeloyl-ACP methyl ester carboxylesterase